MKRYSARGFTLLEMLLVLGLMAMLMLAVMQLMSQTASAWDGSEKSIRAVENDKIALNFIRKMLDKAKPISWRRSEDDSLVSRTFVGEEDVFYFAAPLPAASEKTGMYWFAIHAGQSPHYQRPVLLIDYWLLDDESKEKTLANKKSTEVLMTDVEKITFSYYGDNDYSNGTDDPVWQHEWRDLADPPLAIRMDIKRSRYDENDSDAIPRRDWQGLVIRVLQRKLR